MTDQRVFPITAFSASALPSQLEERDCQSSIANALATGQRVQCTGQLRAGDAKFGNELGYVAAGVILESLFAELVSALDRALGAAVLQRMHRTSVFGSNPIDAFAVQAQFRFRFTFVL